MSHEHVELGIETARAAMHQLKLAGDDSKREGFAEEAAKRYALAEQLDAAILDAVKRADRAKL